MLNTCTVFGLMRFLQNRYFLAILLYTKHNMFIQKKNSNPSQVIKQHEFIITNNKSMRFKIKICLDDSPHRDHTSAFTLEPKGKKLFCGLRFFEHEDNFLVDGENHIYAGLLVRTLWSFCVVFHVASFVTSLVYDA